MILQFREYSNNNFTLFLSIYFGLITLNLTELFVTTYIIDNVFHSKIFSYELILEHKSFLFIEPLFTVLVFYLILRKSNTNNPILISIVAGIFVSVLLLIIQYIFTKTFVKDTFLFSLLSKSILFLTWIILTQTKSNIYNSIGLGYFAYLLVFEVFNLYQNLIQQELIGSISFFLSLGVIGISSYYFSLATKITYKVFTIFRKSMPDL
jgi:hypothetical protein